MKLTRQHRRSARLLWQFVSVDGVPDVNRIREAVLTLRWQEGRDTEAVLRCFAQRLNVYIRANQIGVVSAEPLSADRQAQIAGLFRAPAAVENGIRFYVDEALLGGLRVEKGYQVTDTTIARQLEIFRDGLLKN